MTKEELIKEIEYGLTSDNRFNVKEHEVCPDLIKEICQKHNLNDFVYANDFICSSIENFDKLQEVERELSEHILTGPVCWVPKMRLSKRCCFGVDLNDKHTNTKESIDIDIFIQDILKKYHLSENIVSEMNMIIGTEDENYDDLVLCREELSTMIPVSSLLDVYMNIGKRWFFFYSKKINNTYKNKRKFDIYCDGG